MRRISILLLVFLTCFALAAWPQARPQSGNKIITIDVSGAGPSAGQGTQAFSINDWGAITGWYLDDVFVNHGFLRTPGGTITTFNAPGAGDASGSYEGTVPYMIGSSGALVGFYVDTSLVEHGFLLTPYGTFTAIDVPGAGTGAWQGTIAGSINSSGEIYGWYLDSNTVNHPFLLAPDGEITEFNAPGAGNGPGQGTFVAFNTGINDAGTVTGEYLDPNNVWHGFVRGPHGQITEFNVRGAGTGPGQGTQSSGINAEGAVTGSYLDTNGVNHGFLRAPKGGITKFDYPGAGTGSGQGTGGTMINAEGWIVGNYTDANGVVHGLLRAPNGNLTPFDAPGAGNQSGQGTYSAFINVWGAVTGFYIDTNNMLHGFLLEP